MYEIIELAYDYNLLTTYINKKWHTFLWFNEWLMIFKVKQFSKKSTELMIGKTLLDLIKTLDIEDFKEFGNAEHLKQVMKDFVMYRNAKNEWWTKTKWEMEKVFDVKQRYYTFLRRAKKEAREYRFWLESSIEMINELKEIRYKEKIKNVK